MIIGIDIGGTTIEAGQVIGNKIVKKISVKTASTNKKIISDLKDILVYLEYKKSKGIGIGAPGPADYEKGIIGKTFNLPLGGVHVKKILSKFTKKKVVMNNDASCFVLGESIRLRKKNIIGLTLGTGVGGGIVINGELYQGNGNAGELGHMSICYKGTKSECGNDGCIEQYLSAKGISKLTKKEFDKYGEWLGIGITNLINAFDPDVITLGGGISNSFNKFKPSMNKTIKKRALRNVPVIKGQYESHILGAADLCR